MKAKSRITTTLLIFMTFIFSGYSAVQGQIELTFTGKHNGSYMPFDSVIILNQTQGEYTKLYYPDSVLVLSGSSGINDYAISRKNDLVLSNNYPNPFEGQTFFDVQLSRPATVTITVSDITGRTLSAYRNTLTAGNHQFSFFPGAETMYFLSVRTDRNVETIKMIHSGLASSGKPGIVCNGTKTTLSSMAHDNNMQKSTQADFTYSSGDTLQYIGFITHGKVYQDVIIDTQVETGTVVFETEWEYLEDPLAGLDMAYNIFYYDGSYLRMYPILMDIRSDDCQNTSPWYSNELELFNFSPNNPFLNFPWEHHFKGILRANQVIEYVSLTDLDAELKTRITGEALFLRGLFYYHLLQIYRDVPLFTFLGRNGEALFPAQSPRDSVWKQVISDFSEAVNMLPVTYSQPEDVGRATKGAAMGYLGKTYMITKQWENAASTLESVINSGMYALVVNYRDNFTILNENNCESLFEVQYSISAGGSVRDWAGTGDGTNLDKTSAKAKTYAPQPYGWGDVAPTDWIYEEFLKEKTTDNKDDPRLVASLWYEGNDTLIYGDPEKSLDDLFFTVPVTMANKIFIRKYLNDTDPTVEWSWRSEINERLLRYADILLLYAEALNELGRTIEAYPYINMVRNRACLSNLTPGMTKEEMQEQIAHERALEFCFESIRYTDLLRWGWFEDASKLEILKTRESNFNNFVPGRQFFPVSDYQMSINPNLVQSPGW